MTAAAARVPRADDKAKRGTCRECGRHVAILQLGDGSLLVLDTEVISVVSWPDGREVEPARRLHAALCLGKPAAGPKRRR